MAVGEPFTEAELVHAFGSHLSVHPLGGFLVRYDDENESTVDCTFTEDRTTDSFSVDRPCGDDRLFHALHELLSGRPSFLTYPDDDLVCIVATQASAAAVREAHPELADALKLCSSAQSLIGSW
jgi:hypothetical protein